MKHTPRKGPSGRALGFVTRHSRAFCTSPSTGCGCCGRGRADVFVVVERIVAVIEHDVVVRVVVKG